MKRRTSIAPMMEWTDRHYRVFARILTKHTFLYTEMVTSGALIYGDANRFLSYHESEHPLGLQIGGSNPEDLAKCAKLGEEWGYDEINLNVGCPSDRVQEGKIGACLIAEPQLVADCIQAMKEACHLPVTIKTRLGLDDIEDYDNLSHFVQINANAGCKLFILHARNAWLQGLSPKQNRNIPPLKYDWVYQIKKDFPALWIEINGGIKTCKEMNGHLQYTDSVMIGRAAYENIWLLSEIDSNIYQSNHNKMNRCDALRQYQPYLYSNLDNKVKFSESTKFLNSLFNGIKGAKKWRQALADCTRQNSGWTSLLKIAEEIEANEG